MDFSKSKNNPVRVKRLDERIICHIYTYLLESVFGVRVYV